MTKVTPGVRQALRAIVRTNDADGVLSALSIELSTFADEGDFEKKSTKRRVRKLAAYVGRGLNQ
jgi:hypothetical protein